MVSSTLTAQPSSDAVLMNRRMDDLGVARTLMEVTPSETRSISDCKDSLDSYAGLESLAEQTQHHLPAQAQLSAAIPSPQETAPIATTTEENAESDTVEPDAPTTSTGLDALALLASEEANSTVTTSGAPDRFLTARTGVLASAPNSSDEEDQMPPPLPRRQRSASNPEGMEKWDSLNRVRGGVARRHFVLPEAILEEELAEANAAVRERKLLKSEDKTQTGRANKTIEKTREVREDDEDSKEGENEDEQEEEEEEDESMLTPEDLLRKARSRLLEDLSEGSISGEKGQLMLPHALGKYKHVSTVASVVRFQHWPQDCSSRLTLSCVFWSQVYNKNGRIGIYTPAERTAIIARFNAKRQRRVWNKKIRYNCRKSLADRRLRVKGRFVKRSEQEQLARELQARVEQKVEEDGTSTIAPENDEEKDKDSDMPDVKDPEAGFAPTEDQPYRRFRRYTIT